MDGYIKVFCCNSYGCHICKSMYTDFGPFSTVNQNYLCDLLYKITDYCYHPQTVNDTWKLIITSAIPFPCCPQIQFGCKYSCHLAVVVTSIQKSSQPCILLNLSLYADGFIISLRRWSYIGKINSREEINTQKSDSYVQMVCTDG